jgi:hypothetical protein
MEFGSAPATEEGSPDTGTFFQALLREGISFRNYGEVVGAFGEADGEKVLDHTDLNYPGIFYNQSIADEKKAQYVADRLVGDGDFPRFVYVLLPNDHTYGTSPGKLSPASMVADNDYAVGLLVSAISHSEYWPKTAIFIVQDDPQSSMDHVEAHRSLLVIASPWVARGHTSSVHTSFPSLFRTFELVLGLGPMNRFDANATPLWDAFTSKPDFEPFDALPRKVADVINGESTSLAAQWSAAMDFRGPDRNPDLGAVLWHHVKGAPPPGSHLALAMEGKAPPHPRSPTDIDDVDAYDEGWAKARAWFSAHPEAIARVPPGTFPEALADLERLRPVSSP